MVDDSSEKLPAFLGICYEGGEKRGEAEEQRGAEQHLGRGPVPGTSVWYSLRSVANPPPHPPTSCVSAVAARLSRQMEAWGDRLTLSSAGGVARPRGRLREVSQVNPAVARQLKRAVRFYSQLAD